MAEPFADAITALLERVQVGDENAREQLGRRVYDELHAMAERHMRRAFGAGLPGVTLEPTVLADDTFLKLIKQRQRFDSRGHFFAIATRLMLRVLADYHRKRAAAKRGGGRVRVTLDPDSPEPAPQDATDMAALTDALHTLENLDSRKADVVKLRVLWGLTVDEVAAALGVAQITVARDWKFAKAWLAKELSEGSR